MAEGYRESVAGANRPGNQEVHLRTGANNSRISSLSLMKLDIRQSDGFNVGGTAEVFSSLNLGLGDFLILSRIMEQVGCNRD